MANWNGKARTNYVRVKDYDALLKAVEDLPVEVEPHYKAVNFVTFNAPDNDTGDFYMQYVDDDGEEHHWSWVEDIVPHLAEGQVLILMVIGSEKLRYMTGYAEAYAWDGRRTQINIDEIYSRAAAEFGVKQVDTARCTYQDLPLSEQ